MHKSLIFAAMTLFVSTCVQAEEPAAPKKELTVDDACTLAYGGEIALAANFLKQKSRDGDTKAMVCLADSYSSYPELYKPFGVDEAKAVKWAQTAAEKGDADGQFLVSQLYEMGIGLPKDNALSFQWAEKAAKQGHVSAMMKLANAYVFGGGTNTSMAEAFGWWQKAAEKGNEVALYNLAIAYAKGEGTAADPAKSEEYLLKSVDAGYFIAAEEMAKRLMDNKEYAESDKGKAHIDLLIKALKAQPNQDDPSIVKLLADLQAKFGK